MTHSEQARIANIELALTKMMEILGDKCFAFVPPFESTADEFKEIFATTWHELEDVGWAEEYGSAMGCWRYRLTGAGWIRGLELTGKRMDPGLRRQLVKLLECLAKETKGRSYAIGLVPLVNVVERYGLPRDWIANAIKSNLLGEEFPTRIIDLELETQIIRVPRRFGMRRL